MHSLYPLIQKTRTGLAVLSLGLLLAACGGGGSSSTSSSSGSNGSTGTGTSTVAPTTSTVVPATPTTQIVQGVAATGLALANALITISDSTGASITTTSAADGSYSADVAKLTAPLLIGVSAASGDTVINLYSVVSSKPALGSTATANITPLTHALVALIAPSSNPEELRSPTVLVTAAAAAPVAAASARLNSAISNVLSTAGVNTSTFNAISSTFAANRTGIDAVLELVRVELSGQGVMLTNAVVPDNGNGSASIHLAITGTIASLPAQPSTTVLGELDHFAGLATRCLADAPSIRVTAVDNTGAPTVTSAACQAVPFAANYKSGGFSATQRYKNLLTSADYTGAVFAKPELVFTTDSGDIFFKMPYKAASGAAGIVTDVARKTSPAGKSYAWEIFGNQRDYDSAIDVRLNNVTQLNPNNPSRKNESHYSVALRLFFNPINTAGLNVQAVRVKGPGLPAAGITMHRSSICGANDYMTISSKTGSLHNTAGSAIAWNSGTGNSFILSVEGKNNTFTHSVVASSIGWRDTPIATAELAAIPSFAAYTWELWLFSTNAAGARVYNNFATTTPANISYTQRLSSRLPAIETLKTMPWNSIDSNAFLSATSSLANGGFTATSASWRATAEPVDSLNMYASRNYTSTVANSASPTVATVRVVGDTSLNINATSASVSPANDTAGTQSLVGVVNLTPTVPSCTNVSYPALDSSNGIINASGTYIGSYRDITVRSRASNLARKYVTNVWNTFLE